MTLTLNGAGDPVRYLDVRGDLSEADGEPADRTTIGLYLDRGYAVLSNRRGGDPPDVLEVPLEDALQSGILGNPSDVMKQVLAVCGDVGRTRG